VVGETMFTVSAGAFGPGSGGASAFGKLTGDAAATRLANALHQQLATGCSFLRLDLSDYGRVGQQSEVAAQELRGHRGLRGGRLRHRGIPRLVARLRIDARAIGNGRHRETRPSAGAAAITGRTVVSAMFIVVVQPQTGVPADSA
jgi:hypothetical protein